MPLQLQPRGLFKFFRQRLGLPGPTRQRVFHDSLAIWSPAVVRRVGLLIRGEHHGVPKERPALRHNGGAKLRATQQQCAAQGEETTEFE